MGYEYDSDDRYDSHARDVDPYAGLTREQREAALKAKEISSKLSRDIDRQMDEYERAHPGEEEKEEKFLGILPMPGYMTGVVETGWNTIFGYAAPWLQRNAFEQTQKLGNKFFSNSLKVEHINRASIIAATAAAVVPVAWQPISSVMNGFKAERKDLSDAAKKIAPVLDDVRGKHSLSTFMSVKATDNEMIYAYRKHKQALHQLTHTNNFIKFFNIAPSLLLTGLNSHNATKGKLGEVVEVVADTKKKGLDENTIRNASGLASGVATPIFEAFQKANERKHKRKNRSYTATDMVLELEKQVSAEPNQRDYALPKGSSRRSAPLVEYVMEIIKCHQVDMEALDAEYTPVRKSLDNQLRDVAVPIAEAIKKGDISTLSLIRLVGEGHIVKNKGRSLAKPSEVKTLLEKMSAKASAYVQLDPKEYFADAAFNKKELKEALGVLKGEERTHFAAMFPDVVLAEAGVSEAEIKDMRAATVKHYEENLGKIITGLAAEEDKALHDMGLAKEEIKEIRDIAEQVKAKGEEAVHEVRAKPNNPIGIERVLASAAMGKILAGDVNYMGKLTGTQVVDKAVAVDAIKAKAAEVQEDSADAQDSPKTSHAKREHDRRDLDSGTQELAV